MPLVKVVEQLHMHIYQDIDLVSSGLPGPPALTHLDPPLHRRDFQPKAVAEGNPYILGFDKRFSYIKSARIWSDKTQSWG